MVTLPPRSPAKPTYKLVLGAASGIGPASFCALAYCHAQDEQEIANHPEHQQFTFVLRFHGGRRELIARLPERLNDLWRAPTGVFHGVGAPRGVLEVHGNQVFEVSIDDTPGTFASIWGTTDDHVYACGSHESFWLYRRLGTWHRLELPAGTGGLWCTAGFNEADVYAVSDKGEILHFDGRSVHNLDSPTTRWLTSIAPMPGGRLCIGGYGGLLLYGSGQGWRSVVTGSEDPLLKIVPYRDGVAYLTADGLWWFDGIHTPQRLSPQKGRWLNGIGDVLMIVDDEDAWLFDGNRLQALDTVL